MKKICIIGNSHIGCIKKGIDFHKDIHPSDLTIDMFGSRGDTLKCLQFSEGKLFPDIKEVRDMMSITSGGKKEIDLAIYNAFVLIGLRFHIPRIDNRLSEKVHKSCLIDLFNNSLAKEVCDLIRLGSSSPIWILPSPLNIYEDGLDTTHIAPANKHIKKLTSIYKNEDISFSLQPEETIEKGCFTARSFDVGLKKGYFGEPHLGIDYGEKYSKHAIFGKVYNAL